MRAADEEATLRLGEALGHLVLAGDVIVLAGELGAGKTTFVRGVGTALGVADRVTSPTFSIVHVMAGRVPLVHVDLYRIQSDAGLADLGLDDLLYADGVALVEWGDRFEHLFSEGVLTISFGYLDDGRILEASACGQREEKLLAEWVAACSG